MNVISTEPESPSHPALLGAENDVKTGPVGAGGGGGGGGSSGAVGASAATVGVGDGLGAGVGEVDGVADGVGVGDALGSAAGDSRFANSNTSNTTISTPRTATAAPRIRTVRLAGGRPDETASTGAPTDSPMGTSGFRSSAY
ncbi:MAG: hypothetical protein CVT64_07230 [Actinobacteria bacterium HGW-Actinobacteria-4]|nr:MAG: hypothetical protein CVT64_07230 [Actinobacteria bacterium HGW-Actinobacteria-4]